MPQPNQAWAFVPSVTNAGAHTIRPYLSPNMCLSFSSQAKHEMLRIMNCDEFLYGLQDFVINFQ